MKARRNLILIIVLLLAGGIVFFIERPFEGNRRQSDGDLLVFPDFEPWKADKIQVGSGRLAFENRDGNWFLITPAGSYPADRNQVSAFLQAVRELKRDNIASENEEKQAIFGVRAGQGTQVVLYDSEDRKMADFFVGKKGPDGLSAYIRRADSKEVILQPGTLRDHLDKPAKWWRDRKVFPVKAEDVVQMTLQIDAETIVLNRDTKGGWFIVKPLSKKADGARVEQILTVLNDLEAADFAEEMKPEEAGLVFPQLRLAVRFKGRSTQMLLVGLPANEGGYYAMAGEGQSVIVLQGGVLGILFPEVKDLEAPSIATPRQE